MKKILLALSIAGLASTAALAETSFEKVDANQDGGVTFEEAQTAGLDWTIEQFSKVDSDQNGMLDVDEFTAAMQ